jgi:hypothetical protein
MIYALDPDAGVQLSEHVDGSHGPAIFRAAWG